MTRTRLDHGSITLELAVLAPAILLLLGLVDHGRAVDDRGRLLPSARGQRFRRQRRSSGRSSDDDCEDDA